MTLLEATLAALGGGGAGGGAVYAVVQYKLAQLANLQAANEAAAESRLKKVEDELHKVNGELLREGLGRIQRDLEVIKLGQQRQAEKDAEHGAEIKALKERADKHSDKLDNHVTNLELHRG